MEPGTVLIFGIVLGPLYAVLIGWFRGKPNDNELSLLGVLYLVGLTVGLWGGLLVFSLILGAVFW